jgi:hypothetical protein
MLLAKEAEARASSATFLPAFFVEPLGRGEMIEKGNEPAHVALYPPIAMPYRPKVDELVRFAVKDVKPSDGVTLGERRYDEHEDTSAFRVMGNLSLSLAYHSFFTMLRGFSRESAQPFQPHVIVPHGPSMLREGQRLQFDRISIIETHDQTDSWEVVDVIHLRDKA